MSFINYVKGLISIHTTTDVNSPHIDFDDIQNLSINEIENYGVTGSVQLINNVVDNSRNLLSESCNLWNDGQARKLNHSMYMRAYHTSRVSENSIGVFLITQITASDNLITLTFCDSVQYLRSVGSDYVRNHFESSASWNAVNCKWNGEKAILEHDPTIVIHGGEYHDITMGKLFRSDFDDNNDPQSFQGGYDKMESFTPMSRGVKHLHKIVIKKIYVNPSIITPEQYIEGTFHVMIAPNEYVDRRFKLEMMPKGDKELTFDFTHDGGIPLDVDITGIETYLEFDKNPSEYVMESFKFGMQKDVKGARVNYTYIKSTKLHTYEDHALTMDVIMSYDTENVTGSDAPGIYTIDQVDGEAPTQESIDIVNYWGRAKALYVNPDTRIDAGVVFQRILQAYDFTCDYVQNTRKIYTFRCNGDVIHNYLLALADMPSGVTQFAFRSSKTVWNHINTGYRFNDADPVKKTIKYARDGGGGIDFLSFNPSITLKNNPRLAVAKGVDVNKKPIMVALLDPNVPIGATSTSVNGSITNEVEGALACYSEIMTNRSNHWQGEITLSGIDFSYFVAEDHVGGVPIIINDSRYGFINYRAKVREAKWDFANQKTTIVINNYSEVYSNAILDTSKMAYSAGDMSAEATNVDMFVRQFVNIDASNMTSDGETNECSFTVDEGSEGHITDATRIDMPELNIRVVNAYFPPGNGRSISQYGVNSVKVGNRTHTIPTARRPDKQINQSLIVNVIYRLA